MATLWKNGSRMTHVPLGAILCLTRPSPIESNGPKRTSDNSQNQKHYPCSRPLSPRPRPVSPHRSPPRTSRLESKGGVGEGVHQAQVERQHPAPVAIPGQPHLAELWSITTVWDCNFNKASNGGDWEVGRGLGLGFRPSNTPPVTAPPLTAMAPN